MGKQDVAIELFYDGAWHDLVEDDKVLADTAITITRGQGGESQAPRPASVQFRLDNTDDMFRTSNPLSPLYGKAGRNTPLRILVGGKERARAELTSLSTDQTQDFRQFPKRGKAWADVQAGGLLRRVNNWSKPIRSPLYRAVEKTTLTVAEWWPMEDPSGSSVAVSANGGAPMKPVDFVQYTLGNGSPLPPGGAPDFGRGEGIPGSAALPSFQGGGTLRSFVRGRTFNGYAIDWVMQFQAGSDANGTTSADVLRWRESGTYVSFTVNAVKGSVSVFHADAAADAALTFVGGATANVDPYDGTPHHYRYQVRQNGSNYRAEFYVDSVLWDVADNVATPGAMAGTVGAPTQVDWNPGEQTGDYMPTAAGHTVIWASGQIGGQAPSFFALNGYDRELAATRFGRLMDEEGLAYFVSAGFADSTPMGPQKPDTLVNLLQECVTTEDGLMYDVINTLAVWFICRADRLNQTPAVVLYPADLPALPKEVVDDQGVFNVVTASQRDGSDYVATDTTSTMSTQDPPDGIGEVRRTVDINVTEPDVNGPQQASWWLARGTVAAPRFPTVTVNLAAVDAATVAQVEAVDVGDVIEIHQYREYTIRLFVIGYTETIGTHSRSITFTCAPDDVFNAGVLDSTFRLGARSSYLAFLIDTAATSLSLLSTDQDEQWRTGASGIPIMLDGEQITLGTIGARSGSDPGPYLWSVTGCTRAVNGILKDHDSLTPLTVVNAIRMVLS